MMRQRTSIRKTLCVEQLESRLCPSTYSVVNLGTLGGTSSIAEDINASGQVVGQAYRPGDVGPQGHGFLWQNGTMTDLGTLGGPSSDARAINKFTQVVGGANTSAVDASGNPIGHAFLWQNGVMTDLGTLGGTNSAGWDINASGQVVGAATTASNASDAFVWQNGVMTDLNSLLPANSGWIVSSATGINDNGQITGNGSHNGFQRAFLLSSGVITDLGNLGGPGSSIAHGLNNSGQVVGLGSASNIQSFAFLYSGGVMSNLGSLNGGSSADSEAFAINSSAQVVGLSTFAGGGGLLNPHAALWQNGQITDLNKVIAKNSPWVLSKAFGINDTGSIVGQGSIGGQRHAFLMVPGAPLQAQSVSTVAVTATIGMDQVQSLLGEAIARWQAAGVDTSGLGNLQVHIADLGGTTLGLASGNTIWLDDNAAGWGWFVDATPHNDSEFTTPGNQGEQNRMDLLTVLEHEVGHLLGHDHDEGGVMAETLSAGERWTPSGVYVDGPRLFADPSGADEALDSVTGRRKGW